MVRVVAHDFIFYINKLKLLAVLCCAVPLSAVLCCVPRAEGTRCCSCAACVPSQTSRCRVLAGAMQMQLVTAAAAAVGEGALQLPLDAHQLGLSPCKCLLAFPALCRRTWV